MQPVKQGDGPANLRLCFLRRSAAGPGVRTPLAVANERHVAPASRPAPMTPASSERSGARTICAPRVSRGER